MDTEVKNSRVAMFFILEDARRDNDFKRAAAAQQQLERLGVIVKYKRENRSIRICRGADSK